MKRKQTAATEESPAEAADPPFGEVFDRKFRQHPLVIASSLIIGGFVAGFGARSALPDGTMRDTTVLCLISDVEALEERQHRSRRNLPALDCKQD